MLDMRCLRLGMRLMHIIKNKSIREGVGIKSLLGKVDQGSLKWFRNAERVEEGRVTRRVYRKEVDRVRRWGRPKRRWTHRVGEI